MNLNAVMYGLVVLFPSMEDNSYYIL
jgi:hypothetical protein